MKSFLKLWFIAFLCFVFAFPLDADNGLALGSLLLLFHTISLIALYLLGYVEGSKDNASEDLV